MGEENYEWSLPTNLDEFEKKILEYPENSSALQNMIEKTSDAYNGLPVLLRSLANFDPTGISGAIAQILSEKKAEREQRNIISALYFMGQALMQYGERLKDLEARKELPLLTESYFEFCRNAYQENKIKFFRNIWLNGILRGEKSFDEKIEVFELVASLTEEQIKALKHFYDLQAGMEFEQRKPAHIDELAAALLVDRNRAQQICISLQGRGMLHDYGIGRFNYPGPVGFVITDFVIILVSYIVEPGDANSV